MALPGRDLILLGGNFRKWRTFHGWTQEEMAERLGVEERHYQDVEAGKVEIGVRYLRKIYRALGFDWNATMGGFGAAAEAV
ncbi:MAG: helix-turn-helix transcriptional regulator [Chthoniobacteraceae bacterium]